MLTVLIGTIGKTAEIMYPKASVTWSNPDDLSGNLVPGLYINESNHWDLALVNLEIDNFPRFSYFAGQFSFHLLLKFLFR